SATVMMRLFIVAPPSVLSPTRRSSDLGPTMIAQTDRVKSVASAEPAKVTDTRCEKGQRVILAAGRLAGFRACYGACAPVDGGISDRKSTRLNSSHVKSSYAVLCLKKKK